MTPRTIPLARPIGLMAGAVLWATLAGAQVNVANVAAVQGTVDIQRDGKGERQPAMVGGPVFAGDVVQTGPDGTVALVFVDDAVVTLAPETRIAIERYGKGAAGGGDRRALVRLSRGKLQALVGSPYGREGARFEVETPTAVARVQSTQFVVAYDDKARYTDVLSQDGVVTVQGAIGIIGPAVAVGPKHRTRVHRDKFPSPAQALKADEIAAYAQGLAIVGTGSRESLDVEHPLVSGRIVRQDDRPEMPAAPAGRPAADEASYLRPGAPGETLADGLSPDIRANTQPLPDYRKVPPNEVPP